MFFMTLSPLNDPVAPNGYAARPDWTAVSAAFETQRRKRTLRSFFVKRFFLLLV